MTCVKVEGKSAFVDVSSRRADIETSVRKSTLRLVAYRPTRVKVWLHNTYTAVCN